MIIQSRNPCPVRSPNGFIKGTVKKVGVIYPGVRVACFNRTTMRLVSTTKTDSNGNYLLFGDQLKKHFLVSVDPSFQFNGVIQDNVVPK